MKIHKPKNPSPHDLNYNFCSLKTIKTTVAALMDHYIIFRTTKAPFPFGICISDNGHNINVTACGVEITIHARISNMVDH